MVFFTQLFTTKHGSLAKIWLAAHWEKKITKAHVFECNLEMTIEDIISPQGKIGLRSSGHLLLGIVRIYSRKAKYLLADCSDAVVKIKVAFRPGQLDLPEERMEAMVKAITLPEEFPDFESQLPDLNTIDVVDHFSLNQSRTEEITMKENFGNSFFSMDDLGDETQSHQGLFDTSFQSLCANGDGFGDEGLAFDLVDFIANGNESALLTDSFGESPVEVPATPPPTAINPTALEPSIATSEALPETPTLNETTLLENAEEGFALEPVEVTQKKKGSKKRKLVVDHLKELSNEAIRAQLADYSELLAPLDIAPPTRQLMDWKENGGVDYLFSHFCTPVMGDDLQKLFPRDVLPGKMGPNCKAGDENDPKETREQMREAESESIAVPMMKEMSLLQETAEGNSAAEASSFIEPSFVHMEPSEFNTSRLEVLHPELLSDESMLVHPSEMNSETPPVLTQTQHSSLDSQNVEEKKMTCRAQNLLQTIRKQNSNPDSTYSLHELCENCSRPSAAAMFYCLLVLKKQQAISFHQVAPYSDIIITPGPFFQKL
ncbi:double-strand-break repair protein rad21-like protein 1 [Clarias gariepinus]|uniref:double-strand-break repair protein rad21-like protein 1 n=1 Tax=Clarias gariepinus TaxID=13013 RepID=UPI00234C6210|nr:double-strand-break repair protein rad21-like protein 1 [Clarias gariepinus]